MISFEKPSVEQQEEKSPFENALNVYSIRNRDYRRPRKYTQSDFDKMTEVFVAHNLDVSGVFRGAHITHDKLDVEKGVDIFIEFQDGQILGVDATTTGSPERQRDKILRLRDVESPISGLDEFGKIPIVIVSLTQEKKELLDLIVKNSTEEEVIALLFDKLILGTRIKMEERIRSTPKIGNKERIKAFYEEYLEKLKTAKKEYLNNGKNEKDGRD